MDGIVVGKMTCSTTLMSAVNPFRLLALTIGLTIALFAPSCGPAEPKGTEIGSLVDEVLCANWASFALLESLLGTHVPVHCLLPADGDPANFQPSREQLQRLQRARVVVLHGNQLEAWAERSNLAASRVVDCGVSLLGHLIMEEGKAHSHGAGGEHSHLEPNPYTWLSPILVSKQADALAKSLVQSFPAHSEAIDTAHRQLVEQLANLDADYQAFAASVLPMAASSTGFNGTFPGSHPALLYLNKRYRLSFSGADDPKFDLLLRPSDHALIDRLRGNLSHLQSLTQ